MSRGSLSEGWAASGPYLQKLRRSELEGDGVDQPIEHLYSFVGSTYTHPVRDQLLSLNDDRGFIRDSGDKATVARVQQPGSHEVLRERQRGYDLTLARSAFVLCPLGRCPASIRFFETLRAGRVPVLISDDWELPAGPDWDAFVLRVPESQIAEIPSLLRQQEGEAAELGRLARQAWEDWFADGVIFDRVVGWAISLQQARSDSFFSRLWRQRILLSKEHRRDALRLYQNRWRGR